MKKGDEFYAPFGKVKILGFSNIKGAGKLVKVKYISGILKSCEGNLEIRFLNALDPSSSGQDQSTEPDAQPVEEKTSR